jgi:hypothetical protein
MLRGGSRSIFGVCSKQCSKAGFGEPRHEVILSSSETKYRGGGNVLSVSIPPGSGLYATHLARISDLAVLPERADGAVDALKMSVLDFNIAFPFRARISVRVAFRFLAFVGAPREKPKTDKWRRGPRASLDLPLRPF